MWKWTKLLQLTLKFTYYSRKNFFLFSQIHPNIFQTEALTTKVEKLK